MMGKIQKDVQGNAIINTVGEETGFRAGENGENVFGHYFIMLVSGVWQTSGTG